jgi:SAM-dependent methyltransferase
VSGPQNLDRMTTIYGPTTWDVYARLEESLEPSDPDQLYEIAARYLRADATVLDVGCRDATHLLQLARRHPGITCIGVEPVSVHVEMAHKALDAAPDVADRITVHEGVMQRLPAADASVDLVWCRDVLVQVDDLLSGLREAARVLAPDGRLLAYSSFATERLDGADLAMMRRHLGWIEDNVRRDEMERAFRAAQLEIEDVVEIGTEWREWVEEHFQATSRALLHLSRLRRRRDEIVAWRGQEIFDHIEANLHYEVFLFLDKLRPTIHVLRSS